jgi:hypothetical protein
VSEHVAPPLEPVCSHALTDHKVAELEREAAELRRQVTMDGRS